MENNTKIMTSLAINSDQSFDHRGQTVIDTSIIDRPSQELIHAVGQRRWIYVPDNSGSMNEMCENACTKIMALIYGLVQSIGVAARLMPDGEIALISFNSKATTVCDFVNIEEGYSQLIDATQSLKAGGNTNIPRALEAALSLLGKDAGPNDTIILMTDGHGGNGVPVAEKIKKLGVTIKVMGFGKKPSDVNETMLKKVASVADGKPLYTFDTDKRGFTKTMIENTVTQ